MKQLIIRILTSITRRLINSSPPAVAVAVKDDLLSKIDAYTNGYTSVLSRPKTAAQIHTVSMFAPLKEKVAIVIQGPVVEEHNFTIETIRMYKKNYPDHVIIVSAWNDTPEQVARQLEDEQVIVLLNSKPDKSGALNINFQIRSSLRGIEKAKELGCTYVYKTRSDQRLYATDMTHYLLAVLRQFPLSGITTPQNYRLISSSMTTLKYRPYGIGDMLMFGEINDMLLYWDSKPDDRKMTKEDIPALSVLETAKLKLAETYLCTNFLDKIGYTYDFTLSDSQHVYRSLFYSVDFELLKLFWYKYNWRDESRYDYFQAHTYELLREKDSRLLVAGNQCVNQEDVLHRKEGGQL